MTVRGAVKIPVVGAGIATYHLVYQLARNFAVVSINEQLNPAFIRAMKATGCYDRMTSMRAIRKPLKDPMEKLPYTREELEKEIVRIASKQIKNEEAQLIVLGCAIFSLFLKPGARERLGKKLGVIVVDPQEIAIKTAEMLVNLKLTHSKMEYPQMEF